LFATSTNLESEHTMDDVLKQGEQFA
jgi:hypothetical protein